VGDLAAFAAATRDSQAATESLLLNQVPETTHLAATAVLHGAVAASAFGAGFGGSVWALVESSLVDRFIGSWRADYAAAYPTANAHAQFLEEAAGCGARRDDGGALW
jgi:galactokinase